MVEDTLSRSDGVYRVVELLRVDICERVLGSDEAKQEAVKRKGNLKQRNLDGKHGAIAVKVAHM